MPHTCSQMEGKTVEHNPWKDAAQDPPDREIDPPDDEPEEPDWDSIRKARRDSLNEVLEDIARIRPGL